MKICIPAHPDRHPAILRLAATLGASPDTCLLAVLRVASAAAEQTPDHSWQPSHWDALADLPGLGDAMAHAGLLSEDGRTCSWGPTAANHETEPARGPERRDESASATPPQSTPRRGERYGARYGGCVTLRDSALRGVRYAALRRATRGGKGGLRAQPIAPVQENKNRTGPDRIYCAGEQPESATARDTALLPPTGERYGARTDRQGGSTDGDPGDPAAERKRRLNRERQRRSRERKREAPTPALRPNSSDSGRSHRTPCSGTPGNGEPTATDWMDAIPSLNRRRHRKVAPKPVGALELGIWAPLREQHLTSAAVLTDWHARQLSALWPACGDTEADRLLVLAAGLHAASMPDRQVRRNRVAIFIDTIRRGQWARVLRYLPAAAAALQETEAKHAESERERGSNHAQRRGARA